MPKVIVCSIHSMANKDVQEKRKQNNLKKYGVEHTLQLNEVKEQRIKSNIIKYGVENVSQIDSVKLKKEQTCLKNHGVKHPFQSLIIQEKSKQTCIKKYGVSHPLQNEEIHIKQQKSGFKLKYFLNTNIYYRGGFEFDFLEKYYNKYPDIKNAPTIAYTYDNKERKYFPDFYIPSLNLIIEIKYSYYVKRDKEKIEAKKKAVIASGFNYFIIIDKDYFEFSPVNILTVKSEKPEFLSIFTI